MLGQQFRLKGQEAALRHPESVVLFRDHLTFIGDVMPQARIEMGLLDKANALATTQAEFAEKHVLRLYGESPRGGSEAICHNAVVEDLALPGQVVVGTDSHTCMAGVLGCFAFGVGSTDMANAWFTEDVRVRVPDSVRVTLRGALPAGTTAKDIMLALLALPFFRTSQGIGKVLEFTGDGVFRLPLDERATLTNMAVEAGGFTGIIAADELVIETLEKSRGLSRETLRAMTVTSDEGAHYAHELELDLTALTPMIARTCSLPASISSLKRASMSLNSATRRAASRSRSAAAASAARVSSIVAFNAFLSLSSRASSSCCVLRSDFRSCASSSLARAAAA